MAIPIISFWERYFSISPDEGLGSTYERFIINGIVERIVQKNKIVSVLETPSFGFTGMSGINSMGIALQGVSIKINDSDVTRLNYIDRVWEKYNVDYSSDLVADFSKLPYQDKTYDMSWNFSAMWFVSDLESFYSELDRVTNKVILIMVPNTSGLGYVHQKSTGTDEIQQLNIANIKPENFIAILDNLGWELREQDYLDCPPWPDIGQSKEEFLKKIGLGFLVRKKKAKTKKPLTILDYYSGSDLDMKKNMLRFDIFERYLPDFCKKYWAHHRYYLFLRKNDD